MAETSTPASRPSRFKLATLPNIGLQRRITLYVAVGLAALFGIFAYVAIDSANRSSEVILNERVTVAQILATQIESAILASGNLVDSATSELSTVSEEADIQRIVDRLASNLGEVNLQDGSALVVLFAGSGEVISSSSEENLPASLGDLANQSPQASPQLIHDASGRASLGFVSTNDSRTDPRLTMVALVQPGSGLLTVPATEGDVTTQYRVELVAAGGEILGSSEPVGSEFTSRHSDILDQLANNEAERAVEHVPVGTEGDTVNHVVAFAPLSNSSLGVILEQPEDVALALPNDLRRRILLISGIGLAGGLALAWLTSRQVVRPLEVLTERAREIASGDLDSAVSPSGQDEIRGLGESFEIMRQQLHKSVFELSEWGSTLERRVEERTRELEARNAERSLLLDKIITAQEDERTRVARDLHDQVGQSLTFLVMRMGAAESQFSKSDPELADKIVELRETASEIVGEVRRLISDLRPSVLDDLGLAAALQSLIEERLKETGITQEVTFESIQRELPASTEIAVYRVVQEAISNILKHSGASNVQVSLKVKDRVLHGEVTDNGSGFDTAVAALPGDRGWSVGLLGMSERISLVGGSLSVESQPGSGTSVIFTVPLDTGDST